MKKQFLAIVLTVGMVSSLSGCDTKEAKQSETVNETVVESITEYETEETTENAESESKTEALEETVVEEAADDTISEEMKFVNQVLANYESQDYIILKMDEAEFDINDGSIVQSLSYEVFFDRKNNIACTLSEDIGPKYYDYNNNMAYFLNDDKTGFCKGESEEIKAFFDSAYESLIRSWVNPDSEFTVAEITTTDMDTMESVGTGNYNIFDYFAKVDELYNYELYINVDGETMLPRYNIVSAYSNTDLTLADGTTVPWDMFILKEFSTYAEYITEDSEEFATFGAAVQLPADEKCELVVEE